MRISAIHKKLQNRSDLPVCILQSKDCTKSADASRLLRIRIVFLLLFTFVISAVVPGRSPAFAQTPVPTPGELHKAEEADPDLSSPQQVMKTFLTAMQQLGEGRTEKMEVALKTMDLGDILEFAREEQGRRLAFKLLGIINRTKFDRKRIPDYSEGEPFTLRESPEGKITIQKYGLNWRFSRATVGNIPGIFAAVEEEPLVKEATATVLPDVRDEWVNIRRHIPEALKGRSFYLEDWQWPGILAAVFVSCFIGFLCYHLLKLLTGLLVRKLKFLSTSKSIARFVRPLSFLIGAFLLHLFLLILDLPPAFYARALRVLEVIKIIAVFFVLYRLVDLITEMIQLKPGKIFSGSDEVLLPLLRTAARVILALVGIVLLADLFSLNVTGVVAGLGLGGLAIALAAKDTVENLFGSITVLLDRPFKVGDSVSINGTQGAVEQIGLRSTRLRTPEHSLLTIPNSKLISAVVDNLGARRFWRTRLTLSITYETPPQKIEAFCAGIREMLKSHPQARRDFVVHFNEFASSSLNILVQAYFQVTGFAEDLANKERFFLDIIRLANHLGVEFAYPTQVSYQKEMESQAGPDSENPAGAEDAVSFAQALVKSRTSEKT